MNPLTLPNRGTRRALAKAALAGVAAGLFSGALGAQALDVPNYPLQTGAGNVPPNILYILDDSGSMDNETMPNSFIPTVCRRNSATDTTCRGNRASQMAPPSNTIAYRPDVAYETWVNADGTAFTGGQTFSAAFGDRLRNQEPIDLRNLTSCTDGDNLDLVCGGPQTFLVPKNPADTSVAYLRETRNYWRYQIRVDAGGSPQIVRSELADTGGAGTAWGPAVDSRVITNDFPAINRNAAEQVSHLIPDGWLRVETLASGVAPAFGRVRLEVYVSSTDDLQSRGDRICDANVAANGLVQSCELHGQLSGRYWFRVSAPDVAGNNVTNVRLRITTGGNGCTAPANGVWAWRGCTVAMPNPTRDLAAELANYATYFSYHRTRMKVAKAGSSKAFARLGDNVRIGFRTINNVNSYDIPVGEADGGVFKGTARTTWFSRLFAAGGTSGTPLRNALHRAGQYFQDASAAGPYGPQSGSRQLACRQNFAILTTDGFWNQVNTPWTNGTIGNADGQAGVAILNPRDDSEEVRYAVADPFRDGPSANYSDTLGDIAMRYWKNDLRTDLPNLVPATSGNPAFWQHMSTYGVSIGLRGTLDQGTVAEVMRDGRPRRNGVAVNWPDPTDDENAERIDDLLHAAVNGRGEFIAATDASRFADQLTGLLGQIQSRLAAGSNVAVNSASFQSDTTAFQATYLTGIWTGDLIAREVTPSGISGAEKWRVSQRIEATFADASATNDYNLRTVLTHNGAGGATFPTTAQLAALARTTGGAIVSAANNANYIRGDRSLERSRGGLLRNRAVLLGDIVNSSPFYLRANETIFVGANDGMLHAVNALTGDVRFSYVPKGIDFTRLASLSDPAYAHEFFVDGPVTVSSDRINPNQSILVGTLGRGGKGVYALDVTTPGSMANADVLWDDTGSTDADMGYATGLPLIVKGNNGENLAIVANGINSANEDAALFIYELETGTLLRKIVVGAAGGNGLASPRGADVNVDGLVDYVYAGDLRGNVWKFNLSGPNAAAWGVAFSGLPLFVARDGAGNIQPITGGLAIARQPASPATWVALGTGRLIEESDMTSTTQQSVYVLIDNGSGPITGRSALAARTISATGVSSGLPVRAFESFAPLLPTNRGWFLDLGVPSPAADGERVVSGMRVRGRALFFSSVIPRAGTDCEPTGKGYLNAIDIFTGTSPEGETDSDNDGVGDSTSFFDLNSDGSADATGVNGSPVGSVQLDIGMPTESSQIDNLVLVCGSGGFCDSVDVIAPPGDTVQPRRLSWREIVGEE